MKPRFYHYTCAHGAKGILKVGQVRPLSGWWQMLAVAGARIGTAPNVVWLTDMEEPDAQALGLTSVMLDCDRTEFRFEVTGPRIRPWGEWADENGVNPRCRQMLEEGRDPSHWFVSTLPVRAVLIPYTVIKT